MKRITILAEKMGQGHLSVSRSIQEGLEKHFPGQYNIEIINISDVMGNPIDKLLLSIHSYLSKASPGLYRILFKLGDNVHLIRMANAMVGPKARAAILREIVEPAPDLIFSTFPTWNPLISRLYKSKFPTRPFIVMTTDLVFTHHDWVAAPLADYIIAGDPETAKSLIRIGGDPDKVKTLGFPVKQAVFAPFDRAATLRELGLEASPFTILLLPTVETPKYTQNTINQIETAFPQDNLVVVTGRNEALLSALSTKRNDKTKLVGWVENMVALTKSSDIVITKAGAITVMECINSARPMIINRAVAGEEGNALIVKQNGYGLVLENPYDNIVDSITTIKTNYASYEKHLAAYAYRDATDRIVTFLNGLISTDSTSK